MGSTSIACVVHCTSRAQTQREQPENPGTRPHSKVALQVSLAPSRVTWRACTTQPHRNDACVWVTAIRSIVVEKVLGSLFLGEVLGHARQHRVCVQGSPTRGGDVCLKVCKAADGIDVRGKDLRGLPEGVGALAQLQEIAGQAQKKGCGMGPVPKVLMQRLSCRAQASLACTWHCSAGPASQAGQSMLLASVCVECSIRVLQLMLMQCSLMQLKLLHGTYLGETRAGGEHIQHIHTQVWP